jgi:hypothetical protein
MGTDDGNDDGYKSFIVEGFSFCSDCLAIGWPCALAAMHNDATIPASRHERQPQPNVLPQLNKQLHAYADSAAPNLRELFS